jgi:hypothetical protein
MCTLRIAVLHCLLCTAWSRSSCSAHVLWPSLLLPDLFWVHRHVPCLLPALSAPSELALVTASTLLPWFLACVGLLIGLVALRLQRLVEPCLTLASVSAAGCVQPCMHACIP